MDLRRDVQLAPLTTFRIGGAAAWLAEPATPAELAEAFAFAKREGLAVRLLGGGSNLLVADKGVAGLVVRLSPQSEFATLERLAADGSAWRVGAAVPLARLLRVAAENGRCGLEKLAGIPGTVGGAAAMNAGGDGIGIGDVVVRAAVMDPDGAERILDRSSLAFGYRHSNLDGLTVVWLEVALPDRDDPAAILARISERRARKAATQPIALASAGCVFKNPDARSAGMLIDQAGCKGLRTGGAEVSDLHANFVVNRGGASARDVLALAERMRAAVYGRFGANLELELKTWGFDDEELGPLTGSDHG